MPDPIRKIALSRHATARLAARPELAPEMDLERAAAQPFEAAAMREALCGSATDDETAFKRRLRRLRERALLRVMARDLAGAADLAEVCTTMSQLADASLQAALEWLGERDLVVVAMGKLGGRELNVSSDIDLVFVHPDTKARPFEPERDERTGRRLIALLADVTEDGFAFRVDMRLRPYGDSGALVCSLEALEAYFVAQGREWERYAWIKARAVSGGEADRRALEQVVRPFVYRKYLDYGTLNAMRRLHAEVRRDVARRALRQEILPGEDGQDLQRRPDGQLRVAPAADELQRLGDELDLADAAGAELDVVGEIPPRDIPPYFGVQAAHRRERAVVEVLAVDERPHHALDLRAELGPARDDARLDPRVALPFAALRDEVVLEEVRIAHQRP